MTDFFQLLFAGISLGSLYALVALGFVIIYTSTGVINFAQGGLVLLGLYLTHNFRIGWGLPFPFAVAMAMVVVAAVGVLLERVVLRRMIGQPVFAVVMITIGLLFVINNVVTGIWGFDRLELGDPFGIRTVALGSVRLRVSDIATVVAASVLVGGFFAFFRFTTLGIAMRATALDQEAAIAQGISARRVFGAAWAIAGAVATVAGVMYASGGGGVEPGVGFIALRAFPAIILGGLDSPAGAVVGGVIIGVTQTLTDGYQNDIAPWLGNGFGEVMPYIVMILILLLRPHGLFGTPEVRRV